MQFLQDLREVKGALKELVAIDERHEKDASFELAVSAHRFSQETKEVVDDKLSFSATLMRAGEIAAANRLLAEVEAEVRENEVALIEQVNEVKVARAARRERITRMRLARSLAVAMLGAAVMAMSAAGMAFAGFMQDRAAAEAPADVARQARAEAVQTHAAAAKASLDKKSLERVRVAGMNVSLTPSEMKAYEQLTSGTVNAGVAEHLLSMLPHQLAQTMRDVIGTAKVAEKAVDEVVPNIVTRAAAKAKAKAKAAKKSQEAKDQPSPEPSEQPKDNEEPSPEPTPSDDPDDSNEEPEEDPETIGVPLDEG